MSKRIATLDDLTSDPKNANRGTERGKRLLARSLKRLGAGRSILADKNGVVIAGNKTLAEARAAKLPVTVVDTQGDSLVVVRRTDLDMSKDVRARELAYADNRVAQVDLEWDIPQLEEDLATFGEELGEMFDVAELEAMGVTATGDEGLGGDIDEEQAPQAVAVSRRGDLWVLGDHRLLCGDSTSLEDVARLMGDQRAALIATDPPYGVGYNDETGAGVKATIQNDENDGPKLQAFLEAVFAAALPVLREDAAWYLWHAQLTQGFFAAAAAAAQVSIHRQIIWVKPSLVLGHGDYHWQHELCFYGWRKGGRCPWYGDRSQTTVWAVGRERSTPHPTQKPVELFLRPMRFNTRPGDVCYEPFSGSGSQIVAAQEIGRVCCAMEIEPTFVDVGVRRWQSATGKSAVLDGDGRTFAEVEAARLEHVEATV